MQNLSRYQQSRRITLIGALTNVLLGLFKVFFGVVGHSQALLVDGIHSFSDLITDFLVLLAAKAANQAPDKEHPYGHGRFETVITVALAVFLMLVGLGFIVEAANNILRHAYGVSPSVSVLIVAAVSILANEILFRYTMKVGRRVNSQMLIANAWHHRSDALSSIVVLIGAVGTMLGIHFFDALAAIIVALMIIKMAVKMLWQNVRELVDTGVDEEKQTAIMQAIKSTPGVRSVHQLRSRLLANAIFLDVHVQVDSTISVSEGHYIGDQVQRRLRAAFEDISDITVHIDPEDDETSCPSAYLPDREQLEALLRERWQNLLGYSQIDYIRLDYLNGKVYIEVLLQQGNGIEIIPSIAEIKLQYCQAVSDQDFIAEVKLYFS